MNPTLLQLRTAVRQMTCTTNSNIVTDAEVNQRITEAACALYDEVISTYEHYFVTAFPFTITSGNTAALPSGFYKDNGMDFNPGPNALTVHKLAAYLDRNRRDKRAYGIVDNHIEIYPVANAQGSYQLYYTPICTALEAGGDGATLPAALVPWYEYVQLRAALNIFAKRQLDPGDFARMYQLEEARVRKMVANRTEEPGQVPLTRGARTPFWDEDLPT